MRNMRKHQRFKLNLIDLSSKMSLVGKVEIVNISLGGVALKADRKLNIGKECLMMLEHEGKHINVKGIVVRSELSGIEEKAHERKVTVYSVGVLFKDESADKVKDFLDSIDNDKKAQVPEQANWFYRNIRFCITTSDEKILNLPTQFNIKDISLKGIIIQTDHEMKIDSLIFLELSLDACDLVSFVGKIVSCRMLQDRVHACFDIGVEFSGMTDRGRSLLIRFIDCVKNIEDTVAGCEK